MALTSTPVVERDVHRDDWTVTIAPTHAQRDQLARAFIHWMRTHPKLLSRAVSTEASTVEPRQATIDQLGHVLSRIATYELTGDQAQLLDELLDQAATPPPECAGCHRAYAADASVRIHDQWHTTPGHLCGDCIDAQDTAALAKAGI